MNGEPQLGVYCCCSMPANVEQISGYVAIREGYKDILCTFTRFWEGGEMSNPGSSGLPRVEWAAMAKGRGI